MATNNSLDQNGTPTTTAEGGSGRNSRTAYAVVVGGTTTTAAEQSCATGSAGQVLQSAGSSAVPTYSTPTYPSTSGTARKKLVSDGTNNVYSTETWAVPGTSGNVLTSDGTNWTSAAPAPMAVSNIAGTTQTAAVNTIYVVGNASQTTITLPGTAALGSIVEVIGKGAGGWILTANTGQTINIGELASSTAGTVTSAAKNNTLKVMCVTADTTWTMMSGVSSGYTVA